MRSSAHSERQKRAIAARKLVSRLALLGVLAPGAAAAGQIDATTLFLLRPGMPESEVLVRAGAPDLVSPPGSGGVRIISSNAAAVERWHYIPDRSEHDPHLTIITMTNGRVFNIERRKVFSRDGLPEPPEAAPDRKPSDSEIVRERLERTMEAAERYARTRARLKREDIELRQAAGELPETPTGRGELEIYRGLDADGSAYYGDRPPGESPNVVE